MVGYRPAAFWWELVVVGRKLVLLGFLALVVPGSFLQLFAATVVALCLLVVELFAAPFSSPSNNFLAVAAAFALVLTLQGSLGFKLAQVTRRYMPTHMTT